MSKNIFPLILLTISFNLFSQNFDVRKTNWGFTKQEVINSEYPLTPEVKEKEISYSNVNIGEDTYAKIIYTFTNERLIEVRYIVYGNSRHNNGVGTCTFQVPLYNRYLYTKFIFDTLKAKDYKCYLGWYLSGGYPYKNIVDITGLITDRNTNCSFDKKILDNIDLLAKETKATSTNIVLENERNELSVNFNNPMNLVMEKPCENKIFTADYFNTYYWLVFEPNYKLKKELLKSNF
ncbi:hypothetical protein D3C72_1373910 [compost metagenome]